MTHRLPFAILLALLVALPAVAKDDAAAQDIRITKKFEDVDVREVIRYVAMEAGANVVIADTVQGTVTVDLQGTPWKETLRQVVRVAGFELKEHPYNVFTVVPRQDPTPDPGTDYYRFQHWRPKLSEQVLADPASFEPDLIKALRRIVLPEGQLRWIPSQHAIIFTGTEQSMGLVKAVVIGMEAAMAKQNRLQTKAQQREHYEKLLQGAKSEAAARYFIDKLTELDPKPVRAEYKDK